MKLGINAQYVKEVTLENPNAPGIFTHQSDKPNVDIDIDVGARKLGEDIYEVALALKAVARVVSTNQEDSVAPDEPSGIDNHDEREETRPTLINAFTINLVYAGVFTIQDIEDDSVLEPLLLVECPRLIFPFARSVVANFTREAGYPPLLVNPVDFAALYKEQKIQGRS